MPKVENKYKINNSFGNVLVDICSKNKKEKIIKENSNQDILKEFINNPLKKDGLDLLNNIPDETISTCFFDPQYRGILDKMNYGNEGKIKEKRRSNLEQMGEKKIISFLKEINRVLKPSGHLFFWIDKFHLCEGVNNWFSETILNIVDLIVWEKNQIGMGYRTRNKCEFLMILQKEPLRAKGVWTIHNIPNVIKENVNKKNHPHSKPIELQKRLIEATTKEGDIILDPAFGSCSVFESCKLLNNRSFIGADLNGIIK